MRRILAPLFGTPGDTAGLRAGIDIARRFEGGVIAVHTVPDAYDNFPVVGDAMTPQLLEAAVEASRDLSEARREAARKTFDQVAAEGGGQGSLATWTEQAGRAHAILPRLARVCDMAVIGGLGDKADPSLPIVFEALLFSGGRPVLLVPEGHDGPVGTHIAVAWSDTVEASRALHAARPLLRLADQVEILSVSGDAEDPYRAADVCAYLEAHGVAATTRRVDPQGRKVAEVVLGTCNDRGADLLVAGGYGHSRIGEMVFGGVTRGILENFDIPVLIAH